tara:strand:+ start:348 stop:539 length:192 start_codon:yes stop_codon:yes gene_type:complete
MTKYIVKTNCITYKFVEAESEKQAAEFALSQPINELEETAFVEVEEENEKKMEENPQYFLSGQ